MSIVYLASPLDFVSSGTYSDLNDRRTRLAQSLHALGFGAVFDPGKAWYTAPNADPTPGLQNTNNAVISKCDAVVAYYPDRVSTIGTTLEVKHAVDSHLPTLVVFDRQPKSWALAHLQNRRLWWCTYADLVDAGTVRCDLGSEYAVVKWEGSVNR